MTSSICLLHHVATVTGVPPLNARGTDALAGGGHAQQVCWSPIEKVARRLIAEHYPHLLEAPGPFPVREFLETELYESYGVDFWIVDDLPRGMQGVTVRDEDAQFSAVMLPRQVHQQLCADDPEARFTAAHEIGHALLHGAPGAQLEPGCIPCAGSSVSVGAGAGGLECQADLFAASLLMPSEGVRIFVRSDGEDAGQLARQFGVSQVAAVMRLRQLERQGSAPSEPAREGDSSRS